MTTTIAPRRWWLFFAGALLAWATGAVVYHMALYAYGLEAAKDWFGNFGPLYARSTTAWEAERREVLPVVVASLTAIVWVGLLIWRGRWTHWLLLPAAIAALTINWATARIDGPDAIVEPFTRTDMEYFGDVAAVRDDPQAFIVDYPEMAAIDFWSPWRKLSGHARTHPPGAVLVLWGAGRLIDPSIETAAWTALILSALSVIPALLWTREILDAEATALAAGLCVVTPSLVTFGATSMEGAFMLPTLTALWLGERAIRGKAWHRSLIAVAAGLAMFAAFFMTFASAVVGLLFLGRLAVTLVRRRWDETKRLLLAGVIAAATFAVASLLFGRLTGYDVVANVRVAMNADAGYMGTSTETLGHYFDVSTGNLLAFAIGAGIATLAAGSLGFWRNGKLIAYVIGIVLVGFSALFTLETERVWLFLYPIPIAAAAAGIAAMPSRLQRGFGLGVVAALLLVQTLTFEWVAYTYW